MLWKEADLSVKPHLCSELSEPMGSAWASCGAETHQSGKGVPKYRRGQAQHTWHGGLAASSPTAMVRTPTPDSSSLASCSRVRATHRFEVQHKDFEPDEIHAIACFSVLLAWANFSSNSRRLKLSRQQQQNPPCLRLFEICKKFLFPKWWHPVISGARLDAQFKTANLPLFPLHFS